MPCLRQADLAHGVFAGTEGCFSLFLSEQDHLRLKPGDSRALPTVTQSQAKIPGKGSRRSLGGFPPIPEVFLLALLLGLQSYWGLGMDNTGLQKEMRWVP